MQRKGFTLVELMIVVAILGILGAIVLPTFQDNITEAKVSAAKSNVQTIRAQIELYKFQHNGILPGTAGGGGVTAAVLALQFIGTTMVDGAASPNKIPSAPFLYGPYLLKLPANPLNGKSNIAYSTDFAADAGVVNSGWLYNSSTGQICVNYPGTDPTGVAYISY